MTSNGMDIRLLNVLGVVVSVKVEGTEGYTQIEGTASFSVADNGALTLREFDPDPQGEL